MKRTQNQMTIKPKIFILSNGAVAEPQYFKDFKDHLRARTVKIIESKNLTGSPWQLIQKAIHHRNELEKKGDYSSADGDQIWCVFDIDDYWKTNETLLQQAISRASENGIQLAWSNECFELWFLCHFALLTTTLPRKDYHKKLAEHFQTKRLGTYKKNMGKVFDLLSPFQEVALQNAKKLFKEGRLDENPSTSVGKLVEKLLSL